MGRKKKQQKPKGITCIKGMLYIRMQKDVTDDDGRPVFQPNGKPKRYTKWISTGMADTPDNIAIAIEMRKEYVGDYQDASANYNMTMDKYIHMYLERKKRQLADTAYATYSHNCAHIIKYFGPMKIKNIDRKNIEGFYDEILKDGKRHERTLKDIRARLNDILKLAIKDHIIRDNPLDDAIIDRSLLDKYAKPQEEDDDFFSFTEAQLFLAKADAYFHDDKFSKDYFEMFYFALFFALRREEVLGLKWSAINFNKKTLTICHTVTKGTKINRLNTTKTESSRRVYPLDDKQINILKVLKAREEDMRRLFGSQYQDNDYVFKNPDGSLYYPDTPSKVFARFIKANPDLPQRVTLHHLRTSCVSILIHMNKDIKAIQKWVGHKDIETTLKWYAKVKDKETKQDISDGLIDLYQPQITEYKTIRSCSK